MDSKSESEDNDVESIVNFQSENDGVSSEEEVLPVCSDTESYSEDFSENEVNLSDSDINDHDDDLPDPKAWGRNKKLFYNGDNINDKTSSILNEEDEEAAKMEEEEAKNIQKRLTSKIDDADLAFDLLSDVMSEEKKEVETFSDQHVRIVVDLCQVSEQEKMALLKKESPECLSYIGDFKVLMNCFHNELMPVIKILKKNKFEQSGAGQFIKLYCRIIMNYCTNIVFYMLLKSRRKDTKSHPCNARLIRYRRMMIEAKAIYEEVFEPQIKLVMRGNFEQLLRVNRKRHFINGMRKRRNEKEILMCDQDVDDINTVQDDADNVDADINDPMENSVEDDSNEIKCKRPITYQIAKNKGLIPHRKKELRNPRVKHRMKYRKAKICRKGQIREVRKEIRKYDGEISGIKTNVVKSIKFGVKK